METYRLTGQLGEVYGWLAAQWERTGGARARDWASWRSWGWQSSQRRHKTTYARVCENRKWVNEKPKTSHITYIYKRVLKTNFTVCSSGNGFYCWASRNMMDDTIESTFRAICINVIMYLFARHFPWDNYGFRSFSKHEHVFFSSSSNEPTHTICFIMTHSKYNRIPHTLCCCVLFCVFMPVIVSSMFTNHLFIDQCLLFTIIIFHHINGLIGLGTLNVWKTLVKYEHIIIVRMGDVIIVWVVGSRG